MATDNAKMELTAYDRQRAPHTTITEDLVVTLTTKSGWPAARRVSSQALGLGSGEKTGVLGFKVQESPSEEVRRYIEILPSKK